MRWNLKLYKIVITGCVVLASCTSEETKTITTGDVDSSLNEEVHIVTDTLLNELQFFFIAEEITKEQFEKSAERLKKLRDGFGESSNIKMAWVDQVSRTDTLTWAIHAITKDVELRDKPEEGEEYVHHSFQGIEKELALFRMDGYEWYGFCFISLLNGERTDCDGMPRISENGKNVVSCNGDLTAMYTNNSIQYFRKNNTGHWEEKVVLILSTYEPYDACWETNEAFVVGFRFPDDSHSNQPNRYFRLQLNDKTK
ncbi:MAG: hypothetical protein ACK40M_09730 [Flavobacteriales bacterium]